MKTSQATENTQVTRESTTQDSKQPKQNTNKNNSNNYVLCFDLDGIFYFKLIIIICATFIFNIFDAIDATCLDIMNCHNNDRGYNASNGPCFR